MACAAGEGWGDDASGGGVGGTGKGGGWGCAGGDAKITEAESYAY